MFYNRGLFYHTGFNAAMKKRVPFLLRTENFQLDNLGLNRADYTGGNDSDAIMDQLDNGETPAGIRIVDYQLAGMDPYEFLSR